MRRDVLVEHAEEIEILWSRRRQALWSPRETLDTLAALERRLDAHIEGLALDREGAFEGFATGLAGDDADAAFASAVTLLRQRTVTARDRVWRALVVARPGARNGVGEALAYEPLDPVVEQWLEDARLDDAGPLARVAADVLAAHGRADATPAAPSLAQVRLACGGGERAEANAVFLLGSLGDSSDVPLLVTLTGRATLREPAVRALGSLGVVEAVEALLGIMSNDAASPAAGEAFWRIAGIAPARRDGAPRDDSRFEETRPWTDAEGTRRAWHAVASRFDADCRWRYGRPLDTRRWLEEPHAGDLLTRREEIARLRAEVPGSLRDLVLDAPAARQRLWRA